MYKQAVIEYMMFGTNSMIKTSYDVLNEIIFYAYNVQLFPIVAIDLSVKPAENV